MAEDGKKIYITISDKTGGSGEGDNSSSSNKTTKKTPEQKRNEYLQHEFMHLVRNTINQAVSFSIAQIGNLSGDYATLRNVNNAKALMDKGMNLGLTTLAGAKAGGVVGAVVGLGVGVLGNTISGAMRIHEQAVETKKQNYEIEQLRSRVGMNSVKGNNRDTEN